MGKTAQGAVWTDESRLSSYEYWQFWRNTDDRDVCRFLRLFSELPLDEIMRFESVAGEELNEAKKLLANLATEMCHGRDAARAAAETARNTFEVGGAGGGLPENIPRVLPNGVVAALDTASVEKNASTEVERIIIPPKQEK